MDLRCTSKKHGELTRPSTDCGLVEFKCNSRWCGSSPDVVVIHIFATDTGELLDTKRYRQPIVGR